MAATGHYSTTLEPYGWYERSLVRRLSSPAGYSNLTRGITGRAAIQYSRRLCQYDSWTAVSLFRWWLLCASASADGCHETAFPRTDARTGFEPGWDDP